MIAEVKTCRLDQTRHIDVAQACVSYCEPHISAAWTLGFQQTEGYIHYCTHYRLLSVLREPRSQDISRDAVSFWYQVRVDAGF